jgi:hypothetical protein
MLGHLAICHPLRENDGFPFCLAESDNRSYNRHLFQRKTHLSGQDPPPRHSTLFLSPKLLRHPPASFAQAVNEGNVGRPL